MKACSRDRRLHFVVVTGALVAFATTFALMATPAIATGSASTTSSTTTTSIGGSTTTTLPTSTTTSTVPAGPDMPWPPQGSGAVAIPQLSVAVSSPGSPRVSIASLTKMMTTWVVLHRLPLTFSQRGPCLVVSKYDFELWEHDVASGQSNAAIVAGMTLCEGTLLRGMLVHSAGDYAQLLVAMTGYSAATFVRVMNIDARQLGLRHTHYVDYTGIDPGNVSTAGDQATMAIELMNTYSIVRRIVALAQVTLPVAGVVGSYTPDIGQYGVIGVKSGFTDPAGGCDVMAINVALNHTVITTYAVVLGQHGSNPLGLAGQLALNLSKKLRSSMRVESTSAGRIVVWTGSTVDVVAPPTTTTTTTSTTTTSTTTTVPGG